MAKYHLRTQMRIPGISRIPAGSSLLPSIEHEIEYCMKKYKCSRSFVIATALQDFFGIQADDFRIERSDVEKSKEEARAIAKRENKVVRIVSKAA